jgi:hypothetical protein
VTGAVMTLTVALEMTTGSFVMAVAAVVTAVAAVVIRWQLGGTDEA